MHDSESRLVAILYRVKDLHLLLPAGFYRRFLCVGLCASVAKKWLVVISVPLW